MSGPRCPSGRKDRERRAAAAVMARLGPTMRELRMNSDGEPRLFTMGIKPDGTLRVVTLAADTTHWPRDKDGDGRP